MHSKDNFFLICFIKKFFQFFPQLSWNDHIRTTSVTVVCNNQMIDNPTKYQYMLLGKRKPLKLESKRFKLESAMSVKLLALTTDHNLTLDKYTSNI